MCASRVALGEKYCFSTVMVNTSHLRSSFPASSMVEVSLAGTLERGSGLSEENVWEDILAQQITNTALEEAVKKSPHKWVYLFSEGNASMRELLGGKGAGVAEMTNAGLPVPPGFTITTEACNAYYDSGKQFPQGMWEQ